MATPIWNDEEGRWILRVQKNGKAKKFTSIKPGKAGKQEVLRKSRLYFSEEHKEQTYITVKSAYSEYLNHVAMKNGKESAPYEQAYSIGKHYIVPKVGDKKLTSTALKDWQNCINTAERLNGNGKPLSKKYLCTIRAMITGFTKWAYENDLMDQLKGSLYIPKGHPTKGKEILQPSDLQTLFHPSDRWYHSAWCFMVCTGMRPGECYGLQISDYDKVNKTVTINRSVNARNQITQGKNDNARRIIPLHPIAQKLLEDTIARNERLALNTEWIFCSTTGDKAYPKSSYNSWLEFAKERGLKGTPYSFRHTFISMVKNSMPEQMVKSIVGHSVSMDTFGVYGHMVDGELQQAAQIMDLTFNKGINTDEQSN